MTCRPNDYAFATPDAPEGEGLTKREYFATAVMQGLAAAGDLYKYSAPIGVGLAVEMADALIRELNDA